MLLAYWAFRSHYWVKIMAKNYYLILDTETTQDDLVADFGAIIVDSKGRVVNQCAVMVDGIFTDKENHPLFHQFGDAGDLWSKAGLPARYDRYNRMVASGARMIASVAAINRWLDKAKATYNPILTAYNLAFDAGKCANSGIDLTQFGPRRFCLWAAAYTVFAHTKNYREMALSLHAFNAPTKFQNMSYKTNAETMARFVLGNPTLEDEPHTALEDALYYELPILLAILKRRSARWLLSDAVTSYNWRNCQVKDAFQAK